jgi:cardiolipin synthase
MMPLPIPTEDGHEIRWFDTGRRFLDSHLEAIRNARRSVRLEQYIYAASAIGDEFRAALTDAALRGVRVVVILDALGSRALHTRYFYEMEAAGGRLVWFNPLRWRLFSFRDHRKLMVVDEETAFVGGCNIAEEYAGDGVTHGWRDGGISIRGPAVSALVEAFDGQVERAGQSIWKVRRRAFSGWLEPGRKVAVLLERPGLRQRSFQSMLRHDLHGAKNVAITAAYFLPVGKLRRSILRSVRRARHFRLLFPFHSDVPVLQVATRSLYRRFLRRGAAIFEYQPQNLHAKVIVIDDIVYVGSANLDPRSLRINFELVLRIRCPALAEAARNTFERDLKHSLEVTREHIEKRRTWWTRLKQRLSFWLFCRLDLTVAQILQRRAETKGKDAVAKPNPATQV